MTLGDFSRLCEEAEKRRFEVLLPKDGHGRIVLALAKGRRVHYVWPVPDQSSFDRAAGEALRELQREGVF